MSGLFISLMLAIFPLPFSVAWYRPDWVVLLVIYWAVYRPSSMGVGYAWLIGLLQDVFVDGVWGAHALALSFIAYICSKAYRRLRTYSLSQQTFWVFVFVGIHHVFVNWVQSFTGFSAKPHLMFASVLTGAACWPILVLLLRRLRITASQYN